MYDEVAIAMWCTVYYNKASGTTNSVAAMINNIQMLIILNIYIFTC